MSQIYSQRFISLHGATALTESYTVPAGYVAVVVDVSLAAAGSSGSHLEVTIGDTLLAWLNCQQGATTTVPSTARWNGRAVFYAGETLTVTLGGTGGDVSVSGYLLTD